jgi:hypothetical protein
MKPGILFDERQEQMREMGFQVAFIRVDRVSHKITAVGYRYVGDFVEEQPDEDVRGSGRGDEGCNSLRSRMMVHP